MSATTRAAIATFAGVGLVFGGALFAAGSAMAAAVEHSTGQTGAANECPVGQTYDYSAGECRNGNPGQGPQAGPSATGHGGRG